jgi:hypothetical protein
MRGVYLLMVLFLILAAVIIFFICRKKISAAVFMLSAIVPIFLCSLPFTHNNFERYVSSKEASEYLLKNADINNTILCSRFFVRGVKYYTDKDVAVINIPERQFFSRHPILFLGTDEAAKEFLLKQGVTYCVVKKSGVEDLKRIAGKDLKVTLLKIIGDEYIIKVEVL